jgi:hypothetical protein
MGAVVGLVLLLPWLPSWDQNYLSGWSPAWFSLWMNSYFRGAIGGVGALNVYIAFAETIGLLRGSKGYCSAPFLWRTHPCLPRRDSSRRQGWL